MILAKISPFVYTFRLTGKSRPKFRLMWHLIQYCSMCLYRLKRDTRQAFVEQRLTDSVQYGAFHVGELLSNLNEVFPAQFFGSSEVVNVREQVSHNRLQ